MLAALLFSTVLGATSSPSFSFGIDATEFSASFSVRAPDIDLTLLPHAPTSPDVAVAASMSTVGTGLVLLTASTLTLVLSPHTPRLPVYAGMVAGVLLLDFGANVGDLLNGDTRKFVLNGVLRLLALFVPYGVFVYLAWIALDIVNARHAPARWVHRNYPKQKEKPAEAPPLPRGERPTGLLSFEF